MTAYFDQSDTDEPTPIRTKPEPYCPDCGAKMVLRRPKPNQQWKAFWGCSDWPDCHGKRQIGPDGRPETDDWQPEEMLEW